jgi:hypothetical protein
MPEVAICTENIVIPASGIRTLIKVAGLEYPPENLIQHLSVCLLLFIEPCVRNIAVLDRNWQESDHYDTVG